MYGSDAGTKANIITTKPREIVDRIISEMDRTATIVDAKGGYSESPTHIVLCTVRKNQFTQLKRIVKGADDKAFVIVTETTQVYGEGFKDISEE